jgi:hypothetical protein
MGKAPGTAEVTSRRLQPGCDLCVLEEIADCAMHKAELVAMWEISAAMRYLYQSLAPRDSTRTSGVTLSNASGRGEVRSNVARQQGDGKSRVIR